MAAQQGYFGVCPACPADFKVAGNVTIAGGAGLATFANPQNHDLMGVGACVTYNAGGDVGYVASKVDQSNWYLVDANGAPMPNRGATAVVSITHPFASIAAAEAGYAALTGNADITAGGCNQDLYFPCYCEQGSFTEDSTSVTFDGATMDDTHQGFFYTPYNRANECNMVHRTVEYGVWNPNKYRLNDGVAQTLYFANTAGNVQNWCFAGLQLRNPSTTAGVRYVGLSGMQTGSKIKFEKCTIRMAAIDEDSSRVVFLMYTSTGQTLVVKNCIMMCETELSGLSDSGPWGCDATNTVIAVNNSCINFCRPSVGAFGNLFLYNNAWLRLKAGHEGVNFSSDFNVYHGLDLEEEHGKFSSQETEEMLWDTSGSVENWVWYPKSNSDLRSAGIKLRDEDSGDRDHPDGYRLALETHPIEDHVDGNTWLPTDFLEPRGRWDAGALAYYPQDKLMYGICPGCPADIRVGGECAVLDGIMHFVNAQNHNLMGIGARIQYAGGSVACVVGKLSEYSWMVLTLSGAKPPDTNNTTCTLITHPFGSQSTFEAGFSANLGTSDLTQAEVSMHGVCYCEQTGFTSDNTAVTYDGTTCDENYQLYVYTPCDTVRQCNFNHRVQNGGIWDATRYRLELAAQVLVTGASVLQHLNIYGVQFHMSSNAAAAITAIYVFGTADSRISIEQCVIRVADVNANRLRTAVRVDQGLCKMSHSVAYLIGLNAIQNDFNGIICDGADASLEIYFCTVYGWCRPITRSVVGVIRAECNAIIGNSMGSVGLSVHDYNVYDINQSETHGHLTVQADNALFTAVAGGRETWDWTPATGSDLIFRARHFNDHTQDLDHNAGFRYQGVAPDAGALEREQTICPFGVCPNCPGNIETGAGNVTLVSGVATFDIPQVNVLMGVGADVSYGGGPSHGYVREMVNPFEFVLVTGAGAVPGDAADQAVNSITHPFASQSAAEAGYAALTGNASLVGGDYQLWVPCYCEQTGYTADAVALTINGPTCDRGHEIVFWQTFSTVKESIMQHRAIGGGAWKETLYRREVNGAYNVSLTNVNVTWVIFRGMQFHFNSNANADWRLFFGQSIAGSKTRWISCVGWLDRPANGTSIRGGWLLGVNNSEYEIFNCLTIIDGQTTLANSRTVYVQAALDSMQIQCGSINFYQNFIDTVGGGTHEERGSWMLDQDIATSGITGSDYNLYREVNEGDTNGVLTTQTNKRLFSEYNSTDIELSNWIPGPGGDLIDRSVVGPDLAIECAFMLQGDLDHPFETEWRPQDREGYSRYDIGPLERKFPSLVQWYNYW